MVASVKGERRGTRWSPGTRLFVVFLLITSVVLGGLGVLLAHQARNDARADATRQARQLAQALSGATFGPLLAETNVAPDERARRFWRAVGAARSSAAVISIDVYDATRQVVFSTDPGFVGRRPPAVPALESAFRGGAKAAVVTGGTPVPGKRIDVQAPVRQGGRVIGALAMRLDYAPVADEIHHRVARVWELIGAGALLLYLAVLPSVLWLTRVMRREHDPAARALLADFAESLDKRADVELYYQPIVDMDSGRVTAVEALARWRHPRRGIVLPAEFVPVVERSDLLWRFTLRVIEAAVRQSAAWLRRGWNLPVAVNLSGGAVVDERLPEAVDQLLRRYELPGRYLELELTEAAIMSRPDRAGAVLSELGELGVALIAIDDFGTGYSSLARVWTLPVQALKIDRAFIVEMVERRNPALVTSIIALAHSLGLTVIGEGVEDERTWVELASLNCDRAQGWFLTPPQPAIALEAWIHRHDPTRLAELTHSRPRKERRTGLRRRREDVYAYGPRPARGR
jgi:EAL domain-containing protein (putative c-di-GMP-specific phosphodiesterase class I)